jgi:hypothetical protein
MSNIILGLSFLVALAVAMLLLLRFGRRFGEHRRTQDPEEAKASFGSVDGAVFGLLGLLIAFTFSGAASRLDVRRAQAIDEANCIGTAWLRLDLLPAATKASLRPKLRDYTTARLMSGKKMPDFQAVKAELARAAELQQKIWDEAVAACAASSSSSATMLVLPALNQMFDAASTRTTTAQLHPPTIIYVLLVSLVLVGSLLAGYSLGLGRVRNWFHPAMFLLAMVLAIYIIIDFEFPRVGLIRIESIDRVFVDLLESMKL